MRPARSSLGRLGTSHRHGTMILAGRRRPRPTTPAIAFPLISKVPMAPTAEQSASRRRPPAMGPHTRIVATDVRSEVVQLAKALVGEMRGFRAKQDTVTRRVDACCGLKAGSGLALMLVEVGVVGLWCTRSAGLGEPVTAHRRGPAGPGSSVGGGGGTEQSLIASGQSSSVRPPHARRGKPGHDRHHLLGPPRRRPARAASAG
jgi:hypothetical protein